MTILSHSGERFTDRKEAGMLLAKALISYKNESAVVLGVPRGGVIIAREIATELNADLDIVLAHKLRTQGHTELAMGAVAEDGKLFLNQEIVRELGVREDYIEQEKARQLEEIKRRVDVIRRILPKVPLQDRIVIVTDDGVATGATTQAALWAARGEHPEKLIAAFPVGPEDTIRRLAVEVDEMICLRAPPIFYAVGQFYRQFPPVSDDEMLAILGAEGVKNG